MTDPRLTRYAEVLLDTCLGVRPGWQVVLSGAPPARPLLEELSSLLGARGAYPLLRIGFATGLVSGNRPWLLAAPVELVGEAAPLELETLLRAEAIVVVDSPENTRDLSEVPTERLTALRSAYRPALDRTSAHEVPWVICQYPTPALAQDAGMSTTAFADFLYGACLLDWQAEHDRMARYAERFDAAREVRIVGAGTDLRLGLDGRRMRVDAGGSNMPGGEFFGCPLEDSAEGVVHFAEFPAVYLGHELTGVRLRFEAGVVTDASAETGEDFLHETLATDDGARRLGELGIGCNPGITRFMRNVLFDEKIDGTVHVALGNSFTDLGGTNRSAIHWDIVKDLRRGGRIEVDGEVVQSDGRWLV